MLIRRLREGLAWRMDVWRRRRFLARHFANGAELWSSAVKRTACDRAVLRDGRAIHHPPHQTGFAATILEMWRDQLYTHGFYEPGKGHVVVDAGANVGLFSLWVARRNPAATVYAIEPFPLNFDCLCRNVASLGLTNVRPAHAAVGAAAGHGSVRAMGERSLDHRVLMGGEGEGEASAQVNVLSLGQALDLTGRDRVDFVKMDIEGSEYDIFRTVEASVLDRIDRLAAEYHDPIHPGTRALMEQRLSPTHEVRESRGILYARRRGLGA